MSKANQSEADSLRLTTPEFTGSFVNLIEPKERTNEDGTKKKPLYCITIPLDHDDPWWDKLDRMIEKAAIKKFGEVPKKLVTTRHDGDEMDGEYPEFEGKFMIEAGNDKRKPGLLILDEDGDMSEVVDPDSIYSGARYVAIVRPGGWYHPGSKKKGVSLYLDNVLKVDDGERLGGSTPDAEEDFKGFVRGGSGGATKSKGTNPLD